MITIMNTTDILQLNNKPIHWLNFGNLPLIWDQQLLQSFKEPPLCYDFDDHVDQENRIENPQRYEYDEIVPLGASFES